MAQKEVALIQSRNGKQRDLPNGELGQILFSTDEARVFIGLPSSVQPASLVAGRDQTNAPNRGNENVEILSEFTPFEVINSIVNKPQSISVPASSSASFAFQGTSRLFLDYMAYNGTGSNNVLESGSVQILALQNSTIISQQNNTNQTDGLVQLDFSNPAFNSASKRLTLTITNASTSSFTVEFILRGWDI